MLKVFAIYLMLISYERFFEVVGICAAVKAPRFETIMCLISLKSVFLFVFLKKPHVCWRRKMYNNHFYLYLQVEISGKENGKLSFMGERSS